MKKLHQSILRRMRSSILEDVDVFNGVIHLLKSEYILSDEHIQRIRAAPTKPQRAQILLDILPSRGPYAFDTLRQALRHHYEWLSEDMDKMEENGTIISVTVNDIKFLGNPILPPVSPLTVTRQDKITQLKSAFERIEPGGYIVLHGMKGFGKSSLAASTLKDTKLVRHLFSNEVYWIKFGYERPIDEEILIQLNKLYHLVKNLNILPDPLKPEPLKDSLIHFLQHHFTDDNHKHALLILDDVCDQKIVHAFDFGCKTLVITADVDVLWERRSTIIEMKDGFTESESLGLFAKVLDTEVDLLPAEAKKIHDECKGMPLLIAMFSAQFAEFKHDMQLRPDRWRYYLNSLKNKDENIKVIRKFFEKQEAIFNMCIDQLPDELKARYEELVIFSEDVNITPQTLEILWDGSPFQVEEMMLELCHKSLAAKQWNDELRTYIYGVHDLLLCHIRKKLSKDQLVNMHKRLIEKYRKYCKGNFANLPDDNYSHSYIGHHLEQAKLYNEFPNLYLDFDFIQSMIIHSGLNNLLIDLDNYRSHITKDFNQLYQTRVRDLEKFLEEQASVIAKHKHRNCLDLVQIAMNHRGEGYIKDVCTKLAAERSNKLFVSHDKRIGHIKIPVSEEMSTEVITSCFAYDPHSILIGNDMGEIILWDSLYKKQKLYSGHDKNSIIKKIKVSSDGELFLSLSTDGIVKLFKLCDEEQFHENHTPVQSPRQKQTFWRRMFVSEVPQDDSLAKFYVTGEVILDMAFGHGNNYVAACTDKSTIRIWDRYGTIVTGWNQDYQSNSYLKCITFTTQCNLLHIMDETNGIVTTYGRYGETYRYISQYNPDLQMKKIIYFSDVPERNNSLFIVTEDKATYIKWYRSLNDQIHSYSKQVRANVENQRIVYVCAALTGDGQYLVLADSGGFINLWNISDIGYQPIVTYKSRVHALDAYWIRDEGYHIICGSENHLLHKWMFPVKENHKIIRRQLFDAIVKPFGTKDTLAIETHSNTIIVLCGDDKIAESKPISERMLSLILSSDGKKVLSLTEKGTISLFDVEKEETIPILNMTENIELLQFLNIQNSDIVICRGEDDTLKVWQDTKTMYLVPDVGHVMSIHQLDDTYIITVTRNGIITLWSIDGTEWLRREKLTMPGNVIVNYSCMSYSKDILVVLNGNGETILYKLQEDTTTLPIHRKIVEYFKLSYAQILTCCEMSDDGQYLAVGFGSGHISVVDVPMRKEIRILTFHTTAITQLFWAPSAIGVPILLSVNPDELVWWNTTLGVYGPKRKKRNRMRICRSISSPALTGSASFSFHVPVSQSMDSTVSSIEEQIDGLALKNGADKQFESLDTAKKYWKSKEGKDPTQAELLTVVELPSTSLTKVCISPDFTKFLTVDFHGSISVFTLVGYT